MIDFQTAPYDDLCGCVGVDIPSGLSYLWSEDRSPNHAETRRLIERSEGRRIVCVNCDDCRGTGISKKF